MALIDDITINSTTKVINFPSSTTFYSARSLYSLLMDLFDEQGGTTLAGAMALDVPMTAATPTDFSVVNNWYYSQRLMKYLNGGSIQTSGYLNVIRLLSFQSSGYTNAISTDIGKTVTATGGNTGTLVDYDNTRRVWWVRSSTSWGNSLSVSITSGTGAGTTLSSGGAATGEEKFSNVLTIGSIQHGNIYYLQGTTVVDGTSWYGTGNSTGNGSTGTNLHIDINIKIQEAGTLINSGNVTIFNRQNKSAAGATNGDTYDWFTADLTGLGRNVVALSTSVDLNDSLTDSALLAYMHASMTNPAGTGTAATAAIRVQFGSYTSDVDQDGTSESYEVQIDCASQPLSIVYQVLKSITAKGVSATLNSVAGQVYRYANASYTPVKPAPFGTFAGGRFFGARGVYLTNVASGDASNYETIDSGGTRHVPPTFVSIAVTGLVSGDRVAVFRLSGGAVNKTQFTAAANNNSGNGTFVVQESIPVDTPATGFIRVRHAATDTEQRYAYTAVNSSTKTFTLSGTLSVSYANTDKAYVPYLDTAASGASVSQPVIYPGSDVDVRAVVRNGAGGNKIIPFSVDGTLSSTGFSVPATRTPDTVNTTS